MLQPRGNELLKALLPLALILGLVLLLNMSTETATPDSTHPNRPLEEWLKLTVGYLAVGAEIAAATVIGSAIVRAVASFLSNLFARSRRSLSESVESIRLQLGRMLTLGLEFTVASDILRTAVSPTRQDILNLGAIVLLRTLLNYFLEMEIQQASQSTHPNEIHPPSQ